MTNEQAEAINGTARRYFTDNPHTTTDLLRQMGREKVEVLLKQLMEWQAAAQHLVSLRAENRSMIQQVTELIRLAENVLEEHEQARRDAVDRSAERWARRAFWASVAFGSLSLGLTLFQILK